MKDLVNVREELKELSDKIRDITVIKPVTIRPWAGLEDKACLMHKICTSGMIKADDILPILKDMIKVLDYLLEHPYVDRIVEIPEGYSLTLVKDE